eukprot:scaffold94966_cov93-Phaeocystis_antarctica.AAC.1
MEVEGAQGESTRNLLCSQIMSILVCDTNCITRTEHGNAVDGEVVREQLSTAGKGKRPYAVRVGRWYGERQVKSTPAAEAQAISATKANDAVGSER